MKKFGTMRVNHQDHLEIGGCDTLDLIREFGSPLYVIDEELVRKNCRLYRESFIQGIPGGEVAYASKALPIWL